MPLTLLVPSHILAAQAAQEGKEQQKEIPVIILVRFDSTSASVEQNKKHEYEAGV